MEPIAKEMDLITTIRAGAATRAEDAFDAMYKGRVPEAIEGEVSPMAICTKKEWMEKVIADFVDEVVKSYEAMKATNDARDAAIESFTSVVNRGEHDRE